jgi:hypothetical protein
VVYDDLKKDYLAKTHLYRDSIILTTVVDREIVEAEKCMLDGNEGKALTILKGMLADNPEIKQQAYINYTLSEVYDIRGDIDRQIYHLALTALIDLKTATKEYASLQQLAFLMYQKGDVYRAYRYLQCSMEDAVFCNARLRFFEVSQLLPIIEKAYKQEEEQNKMFSRILLVIACVFSFLLIFVVVWLYRWNKKLTVMRLDLSEANRQLQIVNKELAQTGKIKEAYIAHYLDQCVHIWISWRLTVVHWRSWQWLPELMICSKQSSLSSLYVMKDGIFIEISMMLFWPCIPILSNHLIIC